MLDRSFVLMDFLRMTLVPINVGVNTYHEFYFMICILLPVMECTCWYVY